LQKGQKPIFIELKEAYDQHTTAKVKHILKDLETGNSFQFTIRYNFRAPEAMVEKNCTQNTTTRRNYHN
jgi:hypothetical protein